MRQGSKLLERDRPALIDFALRVALPGNADLESVLTDPLFPARNEVLLGFQIGHFVWNRRRLGNEPKWQIHHRTLKIEFAPKPNLTHDFNLRRQRSQQPDQRGWRNESDSCLALNQLRKVSRELA